MQVTIMSPDLPERLLVPIRAIGDCTTEGKTTSTMYLALIRRYPNFIRAPLDARFFGYISSSIEDAMRRAKFYNYLTEHYYARETEPIHRARRLSDLGGQTADMLLEHGHYLGIDDKPEDFIAYSLAISTLPIGLCIGYGLYLTHVEGRLSGEMKEWKEAPEKTISGISPDAINNMIEIYKNMEWLVSLGKVARKEGGYEIPFAFQKGAIRRRYQYLTFNAAEVQEEISNFEDRRDRSQLSELLIERAKDNNNDEIALTRNEGIKNLIKQYPNIPEKYVEESLTLLGVLRTNLDAVEQRGYEYVFNGLERIGSLSQEFLHEPNKSLKTEIRFDNDTVKIRTSIPDELKEKIRQQIAEKVFHLGVYLHIDHIPQFAERLNLIGNGWTDDAQITMQSPTQLD